MKPSHPLLRRVGRDTVRDGTPWPKKWHKATATASEASVPAGADPNRRMPTTMAATCSLVALPRPVMLCFTRFGAYSLTTKPC